VDSEWLTIQEAADYLKVSIPTIRKYIKLNKLSCYRQARIIRLKKVDLDNFLSRSGNT
jgi:excisionase family DNA binding protein